MKNINFDEFLISDSTNSRRPKIAFVKQDCYPDLYIGGIHDSPLELLQSTQLRIGPLALFSNFDADFYITKYIDKEDLFTRTNLLFLARNPITSHGRVEDIRPHFTQNKKAF